MVAINIRSYMERVRSGARIANIKRQFFDFEYIFVHGTKRAQHGFNSSEPETKQSIAFFQAMAV